MSLYIATYDISDDHRRNRVAKVLENFGQRLQRSVFEVWLDPDEMSELRRRLGPELGLDDELELIPIDQHDNRDRWRWQHQPESYHPILMSEP